eukprot:TRINITY_DN19356_c0_g1_i1.p1 TRINITY_DN19356_c0_g1~~TRINITY_DN19356_c0_g1_i1.p1  ORF type:complete len:136 (-),score=40.39 TRINITY_DN19356_c0_g1_i1:303-710(-)
MYPPPHFRNPPTHRSVVRHRDMRQLGGAGQVAQQEEEKRRERKTHQKNVRAMSDKYGGIRNKRVSQARAAQEALASKQQAMLLAKGIISAEDIKQKQHKKGKPVLAAPQSAWNYEDPPVFRTHACLFLNSYGKAQ